MGKYKHRLIFVDDEEMILESLQRMFRKEGYEIHTANSGAEALKILVDIGKPFSLIVSDQRMPKMNGATFLTQAKNICPKARRIMLSGYSDFDDLIAAVNKGEIHRFLSKPCKDKELILAVRQELDQYDLVLENVRLLALTKKQNQQLFEVSKNLKKNLEQKNLEQRTSEIQAKNKTSKVSPENTIELLLSITNMLNPELCTYMKEVALLSRKVGEQFDLEEEALEQLEIAGFTHDLGLLGLPQKIIRQYPEKMGPKDFILFSQHPLMSQSSLLCIDRFKKAAQIVLQHHERNDGSGFPKGLMGDAISIEARILGAVADYCWIIKMWPIDMQGLMNKGKKSLGIKLANIPLTDCDTLAHFIAEKTLLMGINQKYDIDVVTTLIKLVGVEAENVFEQITLDRLEPGMVLAYSIKHTVKNQVLLNRGVTLTEDLVKLIKQFAQQGLIDKLGLYIDKSKTI